jgi:transposase
MWTDKHRALYGQTDKSFPSNITDEEWARLEPLIPAATRGGRPRKADMRAASRRPGRSASHRPKQVLLLVTKAGTTADQRFFFGSSRPPAGTRQVFREASVGEYPTGALFLCR